MENISNIETVLLGIIVLGSFVAGAVIGAIFIEFRKWP